MKKKLLSPVDRISETLYGVIITLTFTCTIEIAETDSAQKKLMLYAAIGCNIAWGIVDGVMYVLTRYAWKRNKLEILRLIQETKNPHNVREIISDEMSELVVPHLKTDDLENVMQALLKVPHMPQIYSTIREDLLAAIGIFFYAVLSTFPVIIPFIFINDTWLALRISNAIAVVMMFICGWFLGRHAGGRPCFTGLMMSLIGIVLVMIALALGG
jgi:VIT1/CCC1 family predicted Fe2+/Mn2+ transporter